MSISISRTCYFTKNRPQTRMNTGLADSFAKYDTLRKKNARNWKELHKFEFCDVVWLRVVKADFRQGAA